MTEILDFSASINPLDMPTSAIRAVNTALPLVKHYPDPDGSELRQALAKFHGISPHAVLLGNGATELIYALPRALHVRHGVIIGPTFSEYERALELAGAQCTYVFAQGKDSYAPPLDRVVQMLSEGNALSTDMNQRGRGLLPDAVFLCNPNSPTGQVASRDAVLRLLEQVTRCGGCLIVDETFVDYCEQYSVLKEIGQDEALLIIRSLTKFYGMPGLRLGYLVGAVETLEKVRSILPPWSVNVLAQSAAIAVIQDTRFQRRSLTFMKRERAKFLKALQDVPGLQVYTSSTNFVLCELQCGMTAARVAQALESHGVLIRDCSSFSGMNNRALRVAIRRPEENRRFLAILAQVMRG